MNLEETRTILRVLKNQYPQSYSKLSPEDTEEYLKIWAFAFKDIPYEAVRAAVYNIMITDTNNFAPNIATIMQKIYSGNQMSSDEGWAYALTMIRHMTRDREADQELYDALPEEVKAVYCYADFYNMSLMTSSELAQYHKPVFKKEFKAIQTAKLNQAIELKIPSFEKLAYDVQMIEEGDDE